MVRTLGLHSPQIQEALLEVEAAWDRFVKQNLDFKTFNAVEYEAPGYTMYGNEEKGADGELSFYIEDVLGAPVLFMDNYIIHGRGEGARWDAHVAGAIRRTLVQAEEALKSRGLDETPSNLSVVC